MNGIFGPSLRDVAKKSGIVQEVGVAVGDPMLLVSRPGCKVQQLHRDLEYDPSVNFEGRGVGVTAIKEGTRLWVVPGSHLKPKCRRWSRREIKRVAIPKGCTLILHALSVHAGDDETVADRIHFYVDPCVDGCFTRSLPLGVRETNNVGELGHYGPDDYPGLGP